jgi:tetratricopeptide (TPR) repeat protein
LASNAEAEGKTDEALKYYADISSHYASSYLAPMALYYHGRLTEKNGNLKEALQDFENVVQLYPQSVMGTLARRDADRLLSKLGLNVQPQPSPSVASASPSASPQASPAAAGSATPVPQASPRSSLEP